MLGLDRELAVTVCLTDFGGMCMPRRAPIEIPPEATDVGDTQLPRHIVHNHGRHLRWVMKERAQEPDRGELKRETEPVLITTPLLDERAGGVVEVKGPSQLSRGWIADKPAVTPLLVGTQKISRQCGPPFAGQRLKGEIVNDRWKRRKNCPA